jgi:hypothetical protein
MPTPISSDYHAWLIDRLAGRIANGYDPNAPFQADFYPDKSSDNFLRLTVQATPDEVAEAIEYATH